MPHLKDYKLAKCIRTKGCVYLYLLLQLEDAVHQRLRGRRASRNINIHGNDAVAPSGHTVAVVVVSTAVGAAAHGDNPSRLRHLIVDLSQGRSHLVRKSTGNNHDIGLTRRGTENNTEAILIVSWSGEMHHLDGAAGETEGHGPQGGLAGPVSNLIEGCSRKKG
jgi:hypothetical protein